MQKKTHNIVVTTDRALFNQFDSIWREQGFATRNKAIIRMMSYVVQRGAVPSIEDDSTEAKLRLRRADKHGVRIMRRRFHHK
jgi:metal-responsive CopG/Arc/MetJ family transcriptional regulator